MKKKTVKKARPIERGWECPRCGAVMAPWMPNCNNCRGVEVGPSGSWYTCPYCGHLVPTGGWHQCSNTWSR